MYYSNHTQGWYTMGCKPVIYHALSTLDLRGGSTSTREAPHTLAHSMDHLTTQRRSSVVLRTSRRPLPPSLLPPLSLPPPSPPPRSLGSSTALLTWSIRLARRGAHGRKSCIPAGPRVPRCWAPLGSVMDVYTRDTHTHTHTRFRNIRYSGPLPRPRPQLFDHLKQSGPTTARTLPVWELRHFPVLAGPVEPTKALRAPPSPRARGR